MRSDNPFSNAQPIHGFAFSDFLIPGNSIHRKKRSGTKAASFSKKGDNSSLAVS
jgi:hypothetical protein